MGVLIDTGVLIAYERGDSNLGQKIAERHEGDLFLSVITASELLHGVWRAASEAIRARRTAVVEAALDKFPILDIDLQTARVHAQIRAHLSVQGLPIGPHDLWIAATAITHGLTLVTTNEREFSRVPGLLMERW